MGGWKVTESNHLSAYGPFRAYEDPHRVDSLSLYLFLTGSNSAPRSQTQTPILMWTSQ